MSEAIELIKVDFDSLENSLSSAIIKRSIGVFVEGDGLTASGKIAKYFETLAPERRYGGWNHEIYPQYVMKEINLK